MENYHQCSWPADKKGAFSLLLSRKGTSTQTLHDSLRSFFVTFLPLRLFRFLKVFIFLVTSACSFHSLSRLQINKQVINTFKNQETSYFVTQTSQSCCSAAVFTSTTSWKIPHDYTSSVIFGARSHRWWLDSGVEGIMEPQFTFQSTAAAVCSQRQKQQFKMIIKLLLSYGDGKCGVWHALARKSLNVTRGL